MPTSTVYRKGRRTCLQVHLQPRSSRNEIAGRHGKALKIRLTAPPVKNRANRQLLDFLADFFSVAKSEVELISGTRSRSKTIAITGLSVAQVSDRIAPYLVD